MLESVQLKIVQTEFGDYDYCVSDMCPECIQHWYLAFNELIKCPRYIGFSLLLWLGKFELSSAGH